MSNKESNNKQKQEKTKVEMVTECVELLRANRNIILNGAPGTGKTYLAKQIAAEMIGMTYDGENTDNDPSFKEHVRLVQFHPSYDYTDFVEGLRPYYAEDRKDGQIGFRRKNGIFKAFCELAINHKKEIEKEIEKVIEKEIEKVINEILNIISKIQKFKFIHNAGYKESTNLAKINKSNKTAITISANFGENVGDINFDYSTTDIVNFIKNKAEAQDIINILDARQINKVPKVCVASVYKGICDLINKKNQKLYNDIINFDPIPKHVFIIDEINRGEISKIFGELFFSIDPGYRGIKGRVDTQYQNLITDYNDCFKDGFYVPENVYIIGTMNDIDRSVESIDFAFRRRFAFKEVLARDTQYMISDLGDNVINRMTNLNKAITKAGFTSAYHVGASYFLKRNNDKYDFKKLWSYHLEGLLKEYLRGRDDAESILKDWERAYNTEISEA